MKKVKNFTLAERCALTSELCKAEVTIDDDIDAHMNGSLSDDGTRNLASSMAILERATQNKIYGKRAEDYNVTCECASIGAYRVDGVIDSTPENHEMTVDIACAEEDMYKGDNEAEEKLRYFRAGGNYGKRCEDINLDA